jgi:serine/threonine protein kinase
MELPIHLWQSARARGILIGERVYKIFADGAHAEQEREAVQAIGTHAHVVQWLPGGASMLWASHGDLDCARGHVSEAWAQAAMAQLALALVHIQTRGYVHTRVTPCHVLIDADKSTVRLTGLRACARMRDVGVVASLATYEAPFAAPELLHIDTAAHALPLAFDTCEASDGSGNDRAAHAAWHSWALAITILIALCGHSPWTLALPQCTNFATWLEEPTPETLARLCGMKTIENARFAHALCGLLAPNPSTRLLPDDIMHTYK